MLSRILGGAFLGILGVIALGFLAQHPSLLWQIPLALIGLAFVALFALPLIAVLIPARRKPAPPNRAARDALDPTLPAADATRAVPPKLTPIPRTLASSHWRQPINRHPKP